MPDNEIAGSAEIIKSLNVFLNDFIKECGDQLEDVLTDIFSSLPFPSGTANIPKNAMKNNDFYGAACSSFPESATEQ
jgi:hypothetical protein